MHFFVIGGLLFLLFEAVSPKSPEPLDIINVTPERIANLQSGFRKVWRRPPNEQELGTLIDGYIREEIYYREALALGLDRNDTVIRRRLQQKMEFLSDSGGSLLEPAPGELESFLAEHEQTFRLEPRIALEQVFLGENPTQEQINTALTALLAEPSAAPSWHQRSLLPAAITLTEASAVNRLFGNNFFEQIAQTPTDTWSGPVQSSYGIHLVRIGERIAGRLPSLAEITDTVLRDWKTANSQKLREKYYTKLRRQYVVNIDKIHTPAQQKQ